MATCWGAATLLAFQAWELSGVGCYSYGNFPWIWNVSCSFHVQFMFFLARQNFYKLLVNCVPLRQNLDEMSCEDSRWFFTIFGAGGSPISIRGRRFSEAFQGTKQSQIFCAKFVAQTGNTSCIFISFLHIIPSFSRNFQWMLELILLQESSNTFDYLWEKEGCMLMASTSKSSKYLAVASNDVFMCTFFYSPVV